MLLFPACAASNTFCQSDDLGYKCRCYPAINQTMEFPSSPLKIKIIASKSEVQLRRFAMFPNMTSNQHAVIRVIIYMACFKVISMDTLMCVCVSYWPEALAAESCPSHTLQDWMRGDPDRCVSYFRLYWPPLTSDRCSITVCWWWRQGLFTVWEWSLPGRLSTTIVYTLYKC